MLLDYFTRGTEHTVTGGSFGLEIETDFVSLVNGAPISPDINYAIRAYTVGRPAGCTLKPELGRQKIELVLEPCPTPALMFELAAHALEWLYRVAAMYGARPHFEPDFPWHQGALMYDSGDPRDRLWLALDGQAALEELCRCSSVQFSFSINPADAVPAINALWGARVHEFDYKPNDQRWRSYLALSSAPYRQDRYAGPEGFDSLDDYVAQLLRHEVVMHEGRICRLDPQAVPNLDVDLFLRSIWWHFRLRRYGDALVIETRPQARRHDGSIQMQWGNIARTLNF